MAYLKDIHMLEVTFIAAFVLQCEKQNLKALGHDISKRFVTKFKCIVCGPSFR